MTTESSSYLSERAEDTILHVYVQPRAAKSEFSGTFGGRLKIRISSPPVEGEANRECMGFLAAKLGISKSEITLLRGDRSREKTLVISRPAGFVRNKLREAGVEDV